MKKDSRKDADLRRGTPYQKKSGDGVSFLGEETVASANECTGLMPTPPSTEDEAESYADLYTVPAPPQKNDGGERRPGGDHPPRNGEKPTV